MQTNCVREKLRRGEPTIGCFMGLGSTNMAELLGYAGMDWLVIETEHNGLDGAEIQNMLMAIDGTDTVPIVRIPSSNHVYIQRALDMGAMGICVPHVKTAAEAEAIVASTRLPPEGRRSWGPMRGSKYTFDTEDYFNRINDNILVILILETKEAVDNLEAIAAVPGIDVFMIGPWDLSLSLSVNPNNLPLPEIDAVRDQALAICPQYNVAVGDSCQTPEQLRAFQEKGLTFIAYGPDYSLMVATVRAGLEAFDRKE